MINSILELFSSRAIQNTPNMVGRLSFTVFELAEVQVRKNREIRQYWIY